MVVTKEKRDRLLLSLKKREKKGDRQQKQQEQKLKIVNPSICGCDFGDPCCPDNR